MSGGTSLSTWVWPVVLVAGLVLLAMGLVLLRLSPRVVPPATGPDAPIRPASSARTVLDERLARGDIDVAEYQQRAALLDER